MKGKTQTLHSFNATMFGGKNKEKNEKKKIGSKEVATGKSFPPFACSLLSVHKAIGVAYTHPRSNTGAEKDIRFQREMLEC